MCMLCVDLMKQKMTMKEANSNLKELLLDLDEVPRDQLQHLIDLDRAIEDLDIKELERLFDETEKKLSRV